MKTYIKRIEHVLTYLSIGLVYIRAAINYCGEHGSASRHMPFEFGCLIV